MSRTRFSISVSPEDDLYLNDAAYNMHKSKADVVRLIIKEFRETFPERFNENRGFKFKSISERHGTGIQTNYLDEKTKKFHDEN